MRGCNLQTHFKRKENADYPLLSVSLHNTVMAIRCKDANLCWLHLYWLKKKHTLPLCQLDTWALTWIERRRHSIDAQPPAANFHSSFICDISCGVVVCIRVSFKNNLKKRQEKHEERFKQMPVFVRVSYRGLVYATSVYFSVSFSCDLHKDAEMSTPCH